MKNFQNLKKLSDNLDSYENELDKTRLEQWQWKKCEFNVTDRHKNAPKTAEKFYKKWLSQNFKNILGY